MATITVDDVRAAIRDSKLTQQELAARAGITQSAISDFLRGKSGSELARWLRILQIVGISVHPRRRKKS